MRRTALLVAALLPLSLPVQAAPAPTPAENDRCSFATSDPDVAARACSEAIDSRRLSGRDLARAHAVRATAYRARGRFEPAIEDFSAALAIEPAPAGLIERGKTYVMAFRHKEAIADFETVAKQNPAAAKIFEDVADGMMQIGYFAEAALYYEAGMRHTPKDSHLVRRRGDVADYQGQHEEALRFYEAAEQLDPSSAAIHSSRAVVLMHRRDYDRALAELDRALEMQPKFAHARYVRGRALFDIGRFEEAAETFSQVMRDGRRDAYTAIWRYLALARGGRDAREELRALAQTLDRGSWPGPVIGLFLDGLPPDELLELAQHHDPRVTRNQRCEALFFIGQYHLLAGRKDDAQAAFEATVGTGVVAFVEYWHAKRELQRLENP
jgi:lipoprotein NlpI